MDVETEMDMLMKLNTAQGTSIVFKGTVSSSDIGQLLPNRTIKSCNKKYEFEGIYIDKPLYLFNDFAHATAHILGND